MPNPKFNFFILLALYAGCLFAQQPLDSSLPIQIESDTGSFEQIAALASHQGNVTMTQGRNILHADTLQVQKASENKNTIMKATGNPATFQGQVGTTVEPIYATAKTIYYYPEKQLIVLEGQATLNHRQDAFKGPILRYQIDKQIVSATKKNNERPTITIQPRTKL